MKSIVVFDLDGTLSNCEHRLHLVEQGDWDEFHRAGTLDEPYHEAVELAGALVNFGLELWVLTGRNERHRQMTMQWLNNHDIFAESLLMRPDDDFTSDHELKPKLLSDTLDGMDIALEQVLVIFEDRDKVVEAWRNLGFTCYQVRNGTY